MSANAHNEVSMGEIGVTVVVGPHEVSSRAAVRSDAQRAQRLNRRQDCRLTLVENCSYTPFPHGLGVYYYVYQ